MKTLRLVLAITVFFVTSSFAGDISFAREKPNVIVMMADDIGFECYSEYGSRKRSTQPPATDSGWRDPDRPASQADRPKTDPAAWSAVT